MPIEKGITLVRVSNVRVLNKYFSRLPKCIFFATPGVDGSCQQVTSAGWKPPSPLRSQADLGSAAEGYPDSGRRKTTCKQ